jgi:NAD(P)H-dependent FMN reductase
MTTATMAPPKILVIPGSLRTGSYNVMLAALAIKELALADLEVTRLSLEDYPLPIYDADAESRGTPPAALKLKQMIGAHHGVLIVAPEYNASVAPLVKNAVDWVSRVRERNEGTNAAFKGRVFALASASPNPFGGARGLMTLRHVLELGCGALVLPEQVSVPHADQAFDEGGNLAAPAAANSLRAMLDRLVEVARLKRRENP